MTEKKRESNKCGKGPSVQELTELGKHVLDRAHSMINLTSVCPSSVEEMRVMITNIEAEKRMPTKDEFDALYGLLDALGEITGRIEKTMKGMLEFGKGVIFTFEKMPINIFMFDQREKIEALGRNLVTFKYEFCSKLSQQWCLIDRDQLSDCILHLVKNAVEGKAKTITIATSVETTPEGQFIEISVANDGHPIPKEHLAKIFDLSFTTKKKGNGIGLAQVRRIIEAHKGHIDVRSKSGSTEFRLSLPV